MRQPCSNAIHCVCSTVRPLGKGDEFIAALHIKMTRYATRHLKELELANTILHGQVIMPALDNEGAGLEKFYDGGRGGGGNSVLTDVARASFEKWVAKNLSSSNCFHRLGRSFTTTMMMIY